MRASRCHDQMPEVHVPRYENIHIFLYSINGLQFEIGTHLDSHKESPLGESLTNPDRNLFVSWDPTTTFLYGTVAG